MEVKVAFAAGLFCVVFSMFGSSQDIPDDVVYTEVKKTLANGTTGILKCRFNRDPNAVYWKKGSDPENTPSIISWTYGIKFGPRYEDGSCDIDENYSLVIRNVRNADAGRYICQVSNYKGILIDNYIDVTITDVALQTKSAVTLQEGQTATVPCQVNIRPKKVSWVRRTNETLVFIDMSHELIEKSGPGYKGGLFNITKEYSLVIYDVTIQHEDEYFCVVIDYDTENLYQDATSLTVFAYPREPFPVIEECPANSSSSCSLRISSDTTLTCRVDEYYPEMDLYFVRGSERIQSLETKKWNNSDGTMNKRITITADGGADTSFECVATVGPVGQIISRSMTIHLIQGISQFSVAVAVVIPVILVSMLIVIAAYVMKRRKRHLKRKYDKLRMVYKAKQRDLISYIELWKLVKYAREQMLSDKLEKVLDKPIKEEESSKTLRTDEDYYQEFCRWKAEYTGKCQREDFFDACMNAGLESAIDELQNYSDSTRAVTVNDLEHTLWHITESDRIIGLLEDLGAPHDHLVLKDKEKREVVEGAMNILKHWRDVNSSGNQEVMLSLALETIKYTPSDKDFFRIPECQKRGLDKNEIQSFLLPRITSRHCTKLIDATMEISKKYSFATKFFSSKNKDVWTENIIEENRTALFDSHQMIEDWWAEHGSSNYEKRCRLRRPANVTERRTDDLESEGKWLSTKKLEHIAKWVPEERLIQLCKALGISCTSDDLIDEKKRFKTMCRWRDGFTKLKQEKNSIALSTVLESIGFYCLMSPLRSKSIYKAELVDMALDLIMDDFSPFAYSLGIAGTKLASYRQEFRASHLDRGTISLVIQLCKMTEKISASNVRPNVCIILEKAGYPNVIERFISASEPSYGELFAITTAVIQDHIPKDGEGTPESNGKSKQAMRNETVVKTSPGSSSNDGEKAVELHTGPQTTPRLDATLTSRNVKETNDVDGEVMKTQDPGLPPKPMSDIKNRSKHAKSNTGGYQQILNDIQRLLELKDEDIPDSNMDCVLTLLQIWKERVCPGLIDHRVVLAEGLQKIGKPLLAAAVINGEYHSRGTSFEFISDMVNEMDDGKRIAVRRLLEIQKGKQGKVMSLDEMPRRICKWVENWTKAMDGSIKKNLVDVDRFKETSERHRDFNDKLVEKGFLELAREIMNIEQVM